MVLTMFLWTELYSCELPNSFLKILFQAPSLHRPTHYWFLVPYSFSCHFIPPFLSCYGGNPGTALYFFHCKLILFFFPRIAAFLNKALFCQKLLSVIYLLPDSHLSLPALFAQDPASFSKENFMKLWRNCRALSYFLLYLTIWNPFSLTTMLWPPPT